MGLIPEAIIPRSNTRRTLRPPRERKVILEKPNLVIESKSKDTNDDEAPRLIPPASGYPQTDLLASTSDPFLPE